MSGADPLAVNRHRGCVNARAVVNPDGSQIQPRHERPQVSEPGHQQLTSNQGATHPMTGTELIEFFGLPAITRSL
jgi:hypothetical protein